MRASLALVLAVSANVLFVGCAEHPTSPARPLPRATHALTLCRPTANAWFAYQNDGGAWTAPDGHAFSLHATDRLTIAVAAPYPRADGASGSLQVYRIAADQAQAMFGCTPSTAFHYSPNEWDGTVAGLRGDTAAMVTAGIANGWMGNASHPTFTLGNLPDTAVDLLGARVHFLGGTHWEPDVLIARPGERLPNGATVPTLDFDSSEAFALARSNLTVTNVPLLYGGIAYTALQYQDELRTPVGRIDLAGGSLVPVDPNVGPATIATGLFAVPASRQWAPLTYAAKLWLFTTGATPLPTSRIEATMYFRGGGDRWIHFPPAVATPAIRDEASSPYRRDRFDIQGQPEYDAVIDVSFRDAANDYFELYATREYFGGTPASWSLSIPDLSRAPGFTSAWAPRPGSISWEITARNQLDSAWKDGDMARQATLRGDQR